MWLYRLTPRHRWSCQSRASTFQSRSIAFLETECSDEELYWFGEVLEDVVQITQSRMLWKTFSKRAETVVDAEKKKSVIEDCITSEDFFTS